MKDSKRRPYIHIDRGDLDFRDVEGPKLPDGVVVCFSCLGNGKKVQRYCDAPTMTGVCESYLCAGSGFCTRKHAAACRPPSLTRLPA
jgi:hypothetical protein